MRTLVTFGVMALVLVGCKEPDPSLVSGSSTMAASADGSSLYVPDADNGTLVKVNLTSGALESVLLGVEPSRILRIGTTVYVTLAGEGSVALIEDGEQGLQLLDVIKVGAEPYGIAALPDGSAIYVCLGTEDAVVELDPADLTELRRFSVPGQPRWIVMHQRGSHAYVGSAFGGLVHRIDLAEGEVREVALPQMQRGVSADRRNGVPGDAGEDTIVELVPRVTGDLAISPAGDNLAVPVLYVDNTTSVGGPDPSAEHGEFEENSGGGGGYASGNLEGLTRFNPAVVVMPLALGEANEHRATATLVSGQAATQSGMGLPMDADGRPILEAGDDFFESENTRVRGYLSSLTFEPAGHAILATIEGASTVAVVPTHPVQEGVPFNFDDDDIFFGNGEFEATTTVMIGTSEGPRGILFTDDQTAWSYNFIGRSVTRLPYDSADELLDLQLSEGVMREMFLFGAATWNAGATFPMAPSLLAPDVLEGRRMFYSATMPAMASAGAGVSCATCHFEGRNDGLTWTFDHGLRQTPSLAGVVSMSAPVTWTNSVGSVAEEAFITSQGRMGGDGILTSQTLDLAAFIDFTRDADVPLRGSDSAAVARGRGIFERADTACATCHSGERYTDNKSYAMVGEASVNTPALVGVAASGPYLHDGSAETLTDLLRSADRIGMGSTAGLTETELADLELYVRSL